MYPPQCTEVREMGNHLVQLISYLTGDTPTQASFSPLIHTVSHLFVPCFRYKLLEQSMDHDGLTEDQVS